MITVEKDFLPSLVETGDERVVVHALSFAHFPPETPATQAKGNGHE